MSAKSRKPRGLCNGSTGAMLIMVILILLWAVHSKAENKSNPQAQITNADCYVAPYGKDTNRGSDAAPLATVSMARDLVRRKVAAGLTKDILILIRGGTYPQNEALVFGPEDSGTVQYSITYAAYPGERTVLNGGHKITGWKKGNGQTWTTMIPQVKEGRWYFRQLFVDGKRAIRARTPNVDDKIPWWIIKSSTLTEQEDKPYSVTVNSPIQSCRNPKDVELICMYNNEEGRKRLDSIDEQQQTLVVAPPHKWNPKCFGNDWSLCAPEPGKACYLENALEMLDEAGEWYLDRQTGMLSYWPREGEDMERAEVVAPVAQETLLAVVGTPARPVINLHFKGIHVEYIDWPLPATGYNGLFSCNVAAGSMEKPGHRFIEAAVEFKYARYCDFIEGGVAHVGGMGLCLREGTAYNTIEGNELFDLGGGGIGAGGCNVAGGYLYAAPPPGKDEYKGYRIANNYIHQCGVDYYGGTGICLYLAQDSVVAHNLVVEASYSGIVVAGSQNTNVPFAKNNTIERNQVYHAMKTTVDGAGLYVTFAHYGHGTLIRDNLIHGTLWNTFGRGEVASGIHDTIPCHGLYLDGNNTGCTFLNNVVYHNAGGPLLFNTDKNKNEWGENLFQKEGAPPDEFIEAMKSYTGLEPAYQRMILNTEPRPCELYRLADMTGTSPWSALQFNLPNNGRGVVQIIGRNGGKDEMAHVMLRGLDPSCLYHLKGYCGILAKPDKHFYDQTFFGNCDRNLSTTYLAALDDLPILSNVASLNLAGNIQMSGRELNEQGLTMKLEVSSRVFWVVYQKTK